MKHTTENSAAPEVDSLHRDLRTLAEALVEEIDGPTVGRSTVVDGLLDIRNLGSGRDLGLELTVDEMIESIPAGRTISSEWWMHGLSTFVDHATFLAAGYPAVIPELEAA
ncbi:MAG: hypothetical protein ACR2P0_07980 [Acidimicrobiales bacterium]